MNIFHRLRKRFFPTRKEKFQTITTLLADMTRQDAAFINDSYKAIIRQRHISKFCEQNDAPPEAEWDDDDRFLFNLTYPQDK